MPAIAFGTGTVRKDHDATEMTGYVAQALECGFSHISTAQCESIEFFSKVNLSNPSESSVMRRMSERPLEKAV